VNELSRWAEQICLDTQSIWAERLKGRYAGWESGFAVFFSPVIPNPRVLFIGQNPGGGPSDFDERRVVKPPPEHDYVAYNYALARKMKALLPAGFELERTVKTNLNFFRSSRTETLLPDAPAALRNELESFCHDKVLEIIRTLRPTVVLAEALQVFDFIAERMVPGKQPFIARNANGARIYCRVSDPRTSKILGIVLPTGQGAGRLTAADWNRTSELLSEDLGR
jgi:hypothetical protein